MLSYPRSTTSPTLRLPGLAGGERGLWPLDRRCNRPTKQPQPLGGAKNALQLRMLMNFWSNFVSTWNNAILFLFFRFHWGHDVRLLQINLPLHQAKNSFHLATLVRRCFLLGRCCAQPFGFAIVKTQVCRFLKVPLKRLKDGEFCIPKMLQQLILGSPGLMDHK